MKYTSIERKIKYPENQIKASDIQIITVRGNQVVTKEPSIRGTEVDERYSIGVHFMGAFYQVSDSTYAGRTGIEIQTELNHIWSIVRESKITTPRQLREIYLD